MMKDSINGIYQQDIQKIFYNCNINSNNPFEWRNKYDIYSNIDALKINDVLFRFDDGSKMIIGEFDGRIVYKSWKYNNHYAKITYNSNGYIKCKKVEKKCPDYIRDWIKNETLYNKMCHKLEIGKIIQLDAETFQFMFDFSLIHKINYTHIFKKYKYIQIKHNYYKFIPNVECCTLHKLVKMCLTVAKIITFENFESITIYSNNKADVFHLK